MRIASSSFMWVLAVSMIVVGVRPEFEIVDVVNLGRLGIGWQFPYPRPGDRRRSFWSLGFSGSCLRPLLRSGFRSAPPRGPLLLLLPALKFGFPEEDFCEGRIYDVVRRALNESGVSLDDERDRFLDCGLFIEDRHLIPPIGDSGFRESGCQ